MRSHVNECWMELAMRSFSRCVCMKMSLDSWSSLDNAKHARTADPQLQIAARCARTPQVHLCILFRQLQIEHGGQYKIECSHTKMNKKELYVIMRHGRNLCVIILLFYSPLSIEGNQKNARSLCATFWLRHSNAELFLKYNNYSATISNNKRTINESKYPVTRWFKKKTNLMTELKWSRRV